MKDDHHTFVGTGIALPVILFLVMVGELIAGRAYLPKYRYSWFRAIFGPWRAIGPADLEFWALLAAQLGIALFCAGWYGLANTEKFERYAVGVKSAGLILMAIAVLGWLAAFVSTAVS